MIALFMVVLMLFGLIMIFQIGPQVANVSNTLRGTTYSSNFFFLAQLRNVIMALAAFIFAFKFPISVVKKYAKWIFAAGILASIILFIGSIPYMFGGTALPFTQCSLGACRWLNLGFSFQPAEFLKLGLLIYLAAILGVAVRTDEVNTRRTLFLTSTIVAVTMLFVVVLQRDLGTGVVLAAIAFLQVFLSGINKKFLIISTLGALVIGVGFILMSPHRIDRVTTFFTNDPTVIVDDGSYHITHAKVAIGSGGLFGVGIGNSLQAAGYLPEPLNDSIFAIMGETFGFVGLVFTLGVFLALLLRLLYLVRHLHDPTSRAIVIGIFAWVAAHFFTNVMAMIGLVPLTGITLPFLSAGGTSMIFIAFALGLAFQLSTESAHTPAPDPVSKSSKIVPPKRRQTIPVSYNRRSKK